MVAVEELDFLTLVFLLKGLSLMMLFWSNNLLAFNCGAPGTILMNDDDSKHSVNSSKYRHNIVRMWLSTDLDTSVDEEDSSSPSVTTSQTSHMVRGTWLSRLRGPPTYGLPHHLVSHLHAILGCNQNESAPEADVRMFLYSSWMVCEACHMHDKDPKNETCS